MSVLELKVIEGLAEDVGKGLARLDPEDMKKINGVLGDIIEIEGERKTVARITGNFTESMGKKAIQIDGIIRSNAKVTLGESVRIKKISRQAAITVLVSPLDFSNVLPSETELDQFAKILQGLPVMAGDKINVPFLAGKDRFFLAEATSPLGGSIITAWPDPSLWRRTLGALDFLVTIDRYHTADSAYADIVLPATTMYEIDSYMTYGPIFKLREKLIDPVGEARNDYLILTELAERLGYGDAYPRTEDDLLRHVLEGSGFTLEDVRANGGEVRIPTVMMQYKKWEKGQLRDDGKAGFRTPPAAVKFPGRGGMSLKVPHRDVLARGRVRHVGQEVALVIADTALAAQDAVELIVIEYRELPAVADAEAALAPGAPLIHDDVPGNLAFDYEYGDAVKTEEAFARAAHVTRLELDSQRMVGNPMEPKGCLATYDSDTGIYEVYASGQGTSVLRAGLAGMTGVAPDKIRVQMLDVGGGFGIRVQAYTEYAALMLAARTVGRPVKWVGSRSETFVYREVLALRPDRRYERDLSEYAPEALARRMAAALSSAASR